MHIFTSVHFYLPNCYEEVSATNLNVAVLLGRAAYCLGLPLKWKLQTTHLFAQLHDVLLYALQIKYESICYTYVVSPLGRGNRRD